MTLNAFQQWLDNYLNFEKTQTKNIFWLDSMRFLCSRMGNPQDSIKCIHTAGSKGKGSVSAMIASIFEEAGFNCGIYTSPHITNFRERITSPQGFFPDEVYEKSADELTKTVDSIPLKELPGERPLTWFELVTLYAFLCFKNAGCNFVVYETGLGGRLDSTNVVNPILSVLMPIELEHTEFLGDTISKIASEKAGIIKNNVPCLVSFQNYPDAENVFIKKAGEMKSRITFSKDSVSDLNYKICENNQNLSFTLFGKEKYSTHLKLFGKVQAQNAATAALAVRLAEPEITKDAIESGLSKAFLPGRFELCEKNKIRVILDGAHTVKSIQNTLDTVRLMYQKRNIHLLFACAGDKDIKDIIPMFKGRFTSITLTKPTTVRNCQPETALKICRENQIECSLQENLSEAFSNLISTVKKDDIILVTGSFYLVSEIKSML